MADLLAKSYDSLLWQATAARCYSCGSCNLVCPTCYCFEMVEQNDLPPSSGGSSSRKVTSLPANDVAPVGTGARRGTS